MHLRKKIISRLRSLMNEERVERKKRNGWEQYTCLRSIFKYFFEKHLILRNVHTDPILFPFSKKITYNVQVSKRIVIEPYTAVTSLHLSSLNRLTSPFTCLLPLSCWSDSPKPCLFYWSFQGPSFPFYSRIYICDFELVITNVHDFPLPPPTYAGGWHFPAPS